MFKLCTYLVMLCWRFSLLVTLANGLAACVFQPSQSLNPVQIDGLRMQADAGRDGAALVQLQSSAKQGSLDAQRALGHVLLNRSSSAAQLPDILLAQDGLRWLHKAAQSGDLPAQLLLGKTYLSGTSAVHVDHAQARAWLLKAAQTTFPPADESNQRIRASAAYYLGVMDQNGYAGPQNHVASVVWLQIAAQAGLPDAMYLLGNAYAHGDKASSIPQDQRSAAQWYMRAATLEHPLALQEIAYAFQDGNKGLPLSAFQAGQMRQGIEHALKHTKTPP